MTVSEKRQIEDALLFGARYSAGDYKHAQYVHGKQYGKTAILDDMKAALAKVEESKRTLLVHPSIKHRLEEHIEAEGLKHLVRVFQSPHVEEDKMYVFSNHGDLKESDG